MYLHLRGPGALASFLDDPVRFGLSPPGFGVKLAGCCGAFKNVVFYSIMARITHTCYSERSNEQSGSSLESNYESHKTSAAMDLTRDDTALSTYRRRAEPPPLPKLAIKRV